MQPKLLDGYLTPDQLAAEFGCCVETLKRWKRAGEGPPVTYIGRYPYYARAGAMAWLQSRDREQKKQPVRSSTRAGGRPASFLWLPVRER